MNETKDTRVIVASYSISKTKEYTDKKGVIHPPEEYYKIRGADKLTYNVKKSVLPEINEGDEFYVEYTTTEYMYKGESVQSKWIQSILPDDGDPFSEEPLVEQKGPERQPPKPDTNKPTLTGPADPMLVLASVILAPSVANETTGEKVLDKVARIYRGLSEIK